MTRDADVIHDMVVTDIVRRRYPDQAEDVIKDVVTLFGVQSGLGRALAETPEVLQTDGEIQDIGAARAGGNGELPRFSGGDNFVRATRRFIDVRDLQVDLLDGHREFQDAYELLSKALNEDMLTRLHGEVRAMKVTVTQVEAERLVPRMREFMDREKREPSLNAENGREVRLADALAFMRRLSHQRRFDLGGSDAAKGGGQARG